MVEEYYCPVEATYKTLEEARKCINASEEGCNISVDDSGLCNVRILYNDAHPEDK